jgi:hypothetical protein
MTIRNSSDGNDTRQYLAGQDTHGVASFFRTTMETDSDLCSLDEKGQQVVRALENPKYDWRTIDGISTETGISPQQVSLILQFLPSVVDIVQSSAPDKKGRQLFTTRNHFNRRQSIASRILSAFSDRIK